MSEKLENQELIQGMESTEEIEFNCKQINSIRMLTRVYYDYQREHLSLLNRLGLKKNGESKKGAPERDAEFLTYLMMRKDSIENRMKMVESQLAGIVKQHKLWDYFLKDVKGCGPLMAAVLISEIDINKAVMASQIVSFAGLAPGKDKRVKGEKSTFNGFLKAKVLGVLGPSFLRSKDTCVYADVYYDTKNRLHSMNWGNDSKNPTDKNNPKAGHQHNAAMRKMMKIFLQDLYAKWREVEGLSVRPPYAEEYLGKVHGSFGSQ